MRVVFTSLLLGALLNSPVWAQEPIPKACSDLQFFKALGDGEIFFSDTYVEGEFQHPVAHKAVVRIFQENVKNYKKLPYWVQNGEGWLAPRWGDPGSNVAYDGCSVWKRQEWFTRWIFRPHSADSGYGFIAINLTSKTILMRLSDAPPNSDEAPTIYQVGDDSSIKEFLHAYPDLDQ